LSHATTNEKIDERDLGALGWTDHEARAMASTLEETPALSGAVPARVAAVHRGAVVLALEIDETVEATLTGKLRHTNTVETPVAVGDWVLSVPCGDGEHLVVHLLPRRNELARRAAGRAHEQQVLAGNVDTVIVVMGVDGDFNVRRLERYVAFGHAGEADVVVVLSKVDMLDDPGDTSDAPDLDALVERARLAAPGVPVVTSSVVDEPGIGELLPYLGGGRTCVLVGSSGAGKSSLLNALAGRELMAVGAVRARDHRGQHTTSHRELFPLRPGGEDLGMVIDTPGMRELGMLDAPHALAESFADVHALSLECRFRDCEHTEEPGCAVLAAVEDGALDVDRLESYRKLRREQERIRRKTDKAARIQAHKARLATERARRPKARARRRIWAMSAGASIEAIQNADGLDDDGDTSSKRAVGRDEESEVRNLDDLDHRTGG